METIIRKLYQSKEWKIAIVDDYAIKIWKRQPDKTWRTWMSIYATPSFIGKNQNSYIITDDRITDDGKQTHEFYSAMDYMGIQYYTEAPVTQRHCDALDACLLAKNMLQEK